MSSPFPRPKPIICQVNQMLPAQSCGSREADSIYLCEVIGPHDRCRVGRHTIEHSRLGNGHSCESVDRYIDRWRRQDWQKYVR